MVGIRMFSPTNGHPWPLVLNEPQILLADDRPGSPADRDNALYSTSRSPNPTSDNFVLLQLGLIDGLSDLRTKMRDVFGEDVRFKLVSTGGGLLRRNKKSVSAGAGGFELGGWPQGFAADVISAIEARSLWSRFGL